MVQKEGPVNPQRLVRDLRTILKIAPNPPPVRAILLMGPNRGYGCFSYGAFYAIGYWAGNGPGNGLPMADIRAQKE